MNELVTARPLVKDLVAQRLPAMLGALPTDRKTAIERFRRAAVAIASAPGVSQCEPNSVLSAIYACARLNLVPDPVLKQVYIIPFKSKATLVIGYNGYIDLARRADPSLVLNTGVVYEGDDYTLLEGTEQRLTITRRRWQKGLKEPGRVLFSYCCHRFANAAVNTTIVPGPVLYHAQATARSGNRPGSPWHDHFEAMCEKTAIRRASKTWTMQSDADEGRRFNEAAQYDEAEELPPAPEPETLTLGLEDGDHRLADLTQPATEKSE